MKKDKELKEATIKLIVKLLEFPDDEMENNILKLRNNWSQSKSPQEITDQYFSEIERVIKQIKAPRSQANELQG